MDKALGWLALATLALFLNACGSDSTDQVEETAVRPIKLVVLEAADAGESRRFPAVVEAAESSTLTFQASGQVQELPVTEAQVVEKGAVLPRLDPRDLQSNFDSVKAQFDNAEAEYQRAERLAAGDAISKRELEQRKSQRDTAKAQLNTATKALDDTVLVAPFAGVVAKVHVQKLQTVQPLEAVVTVIGQGQREVAIDVPASIVARSKTAGEANAFVMLDAAPSVRIPAQFKEAALEADSTTQTYEVKLSFEPPEDLVILPGMNATVVFESVPSEASGEEANSAGVAVPLAAVQSEGERNFVWVIDPESMTASKRWVTMQWLARISSPSVSGSTPRSPPAKTSVPWAWNCTSITTRARWSTPRSRISSPTWSPPSPSLSSPC